MTKSLDPVYLCRMPFTELREVIASGVDFLDEEGAESKVDPDDPAVQKVMILDALTQFLDGI